MIFQGLYKTIKKITKPLNFLILFIMSNSNFIQAQDNNLALVLKQAPNSIDSLYNRNLDFVTGTTELTDTNLTKYNNIIPPGYERIIFNLPGNWVTWFNDMFKEDNLPILAGIIASTALAIETDAETWKPFHDEYNRNDNFRKANDLFEFIGNGGFQFGLSAGFGLYGFLTDDNRAIRTSVQIAEVILTCGAMVQTLKRITGRERPSENTSTTGTWRFLPSPIDYQQNVAKFDAFPSGHFATAVATMTVIIENYPDNEWLKYIGYPLTGLVAMGLVSKDMHWWSDFPLSLVLGYSFAKVVTSGNSEKINEVRNPFKPQVGVTYLNPETLGIKLTWIF